MRLIPGFFVLLLAGLLSACGADKPLATVNQVDLERYSGTWYQIARLPSAAATTPLPATPSMRTAPCA